MAFADRLVHDLVIVTPTQDVEEEVDDYGHPLPGVATETEVAGLIQPKSAREVELSSQAGAMLADHVVFLPNGTAIGNGSYVRFSEDNGDRYEVTGIRSFAYGREPHLEVDCRRVVSDVLVTS